MKKIYTMITVLLLGLTILQAQTVIETFDTAAADSAFIHNSEQGAGKAVLTDDTSNKVEGTASLKIKAVVPEMNQWGSYFHFEKNIPDSTYVNWMKYDTLSLMFNIEQAPTIPANWVFRMHIQDQLSWDGDKEEYIFEEAVKFDTLTNGWVELKIPLIDRDVNGNELPNNEGFCFVPSSWYSASTNNSQIDWDKIVYWTLTFVTTGWDAEKNLPADSIVVSFDDLKPISNRKIPHIFFNGKTLAAPLTVEPFSWGQSTMEIVENAGATEKTNALKWTQGNEWGNGWTGTGWNIDPAYDMESIWETDSLKFKLKAPAGTGDLAVQFEDGSAKLRKVFTPVADGEWHQYALKLADFIYEEGTDFNPANVTVFQFIAQESAEAGRVIWIDDIWTGNPSFDIVAPEAVQFPQATAASYQNLITWSDVPGEVNEVYTVYASLNQITDLEDPSVELVANGIKEGEQSVSHQIVSPTADQELTYYYAIVCMDEAGNKSPLADAGSVTNTAKGITVISVTPPVFVADGNLSEWTGIAPIVMKPSDNSAAILTNSDVDGDNDVSASTYLAIDNDFLYVAFDVEDDIIDTTAANSWDKDAPDLFIGLYNAQGLTHNSLKRGDEPDYQFRFNQDALIIDNMGKREVAKVSDANYSWTPKFPTGYVVEAKISLDSLAKWGEDKRYYYSVGHKLHLDIAINDADGGDAREGLISYSKINEDKSYQTVERWFYTFVGDGFVVNVDDIAETPTEFSLSQNYPNPFNPTTTIEYSVKEETQVTLVVYNVLGEKVATVVNETKQPGEYKVNLDASKYSSGMYIYQIRMKDFTKSKKMLLLK